MIGTAPPIRMITARRDPVKERIVIRRVRVSRERGNHANSGNVLLLRLARERPGESCSQASHERAASDHSIT
jgi:hypothetical protein